MDLAFIDGLRMFRVLAARLTINVRKLAHPGSVVVFDDMLPRTNEEAARERLTTSWARRRLQRSRSPSKRYRPDLVIPCLSTPARPDLLLVVGLDPTKHGAAGQVRRRRGGVRGDDRRKCRPRS